jgi:plastocyanin
VACLVALAASGCNRDSDAKSDAGARITDRIEMSDYAFTPATILGTSGRQLTIALVNKAEVVHNFSIEGTPVDVDVAAGKSRTVIFVPDAAGNGKFFCKIHRERGMTGTLQTSPAPGAGSSLP